MQNSLLSGLSGLRVNQQYLDVIGNNLANASTPGYKGSRVVFVDVLSQTIAPGTGPTGNTGGTNPKQVGRGASVGTIDRSMIQGSMLSTGRNLDLAIQGSGFFILSDGLQDFYSRVGTFEVDAANYLVDKRTGLRVQDVTGNDILIEMNGVAPPEATTNIDFQGNLPSDFQGPVAELLRTGNVITEEHRGVLSGNAGPYDLSGVVPGELWITTGPGGATQKINLDFQAPTFDPTAVTAAELAAALNAAGINGATASDVGGALTLTTTEYGSNAQVLVDLVNGIGSSIFSTGSASGSAANATLTTDLNDLGINITDYVAGDTVQIRGTRPDGVIVQGGFTYGTGAGEDGTTLGDFIAKINLTFGSTESGGATATFNETTGKLELEANASGDANLTLQLLDGTSNSNKSNWADLNITNVRPGTDPDQENVVTTVYDSMGEAHSVTFVFARAEDGTWSISAEVDENDGTVTSQPVTGITFDTNGNLNIIPDAKMSFSWTGVPATQEITFGLGTTGQADGLTQYGLAGSVYGAADGNTAGTLTDVAVRRDGYIEGTYTNGTVKTMQQVGMAIFSNAAGMDHLGNNLFGITSNSGDVFRTAPQEGPAGMIMAGSLEGSNVDIAEEFVRLIEAQRGFQASARIVSTTDEVLAELVNIV